jgi:hypothetical protein
MSNDPDALFRLIALAALAGEIPQPEVVHEGETIRVRGWFVAEAKPETITFPAEDK